MNNRINRLTAILDTLLLPQNTQQGKQKTQKMDSPLTAAVLTENRQTDTSTGVQHLRVGKINPKPFDVANGSEVGCLIMPPSPQDFTTLSKTISRSLTQRSLLTQQIK